MCGKKRYDGRYHKHKRKGFVVSPDQTSIRTLRLVTLDALSPGLSRFEHLLVTLSLPFLFVSKAW